MNDTILNKFSSHGISQSGKYKLENETRDEFYTNYPLYKYWNRENNDKVIEIPGINIYIHIPFCIQICDFCFYMKELIKSKDQVDTYVNSLCEEIKIVSENFGLGNRNVESIYIGGGTPSVLTESQLKKIIETLNKYHKIADSEFTFEAEPGTFTATKLNWYKDCGVNRISMGVQSFNDEIIKLSSRKHTKLQAINSIKLVQDYQSFNLNIDLLSGLAGENMRTWNETIELALNLDIDMLTIYKMKTYSNTLFFKQGVYKNEIDLPDKEEEVGFMSKAIELIKGSDYKMWSTFAFTKDNYLHKYIENTWRGKDLLAYGCSSFGHIHDCNYQNINEIQSYNQAVLSNKIPINRSFKLTIKDKIIKELLLCSSRLYSYSKSEFINKFGFDYFDLIPEVMVSLVETGFIENQLDELVLTDKGILYADFIGQTIASEVKSKIGYDKIGFNY
ncbi:radical SAM family heme chaperone HemW [Sphingobacterium siyangense]|uniref:radical SAM family heme chaperone HemW n=1 Tax=Sphingobacterium siyangense TaxID=459529 RepID=UPI0028A26931|nr:radical SAM family heme chaperone HemW [Sphingobacterium siyangense]